MSPPPMGKKDLLSPREVMATNILKNKEISGGKSEGKELVLQSVKEE